MGSISHIEIRGYSLERPIFFCIQKVSMCLSFGAVRELTCPTNPILIRISKCQHKVKDKVQFMVVLPVWFQLSPFLSSF